MAGVAQRKPPPMSIQEFRTFLTERPERERWELIDGVAIMMTPPTLVHQIIASNLQRLLYEALGRRAPSLTVLQRLGVNVSPTVDNYDPEPDVAVIDAAIPDIDQRYVNRLYLAAEVVSSSDRTWVHKKREIYKKNEACTCVLTIQQDRLEVRFDIKTGGSWEHRALTNLDDTLDLPDFGLRCTLADVYRGTPFQAR